MWPMYWSFSFSISTSDEYSGLISFKMDWLDLLAVQGTLIVFEFISSPALLTGAASRKLLQVSILSESLKLS